MEDSHSFYQSSPTPTTPSNFVDSFPPTSPENDITSFLNQSLSDIDDDDDDDDNQVSFLSQQQQNPTSSIYPNLTRFNKHHKHNNKHNKYLTPTRRLMRHSLVLFIILSILIFIGTYLVVPLNSWFPAIDWDNTAEIIADPAKGTYYFDPIFDKPNSDSIYLFLNNNNHSTYLEEWSITVPDSFSNAIKDPDHDSDYNGPITKHLSSKAIDPCSIIFCGCHDPIHNLGFLFCDLGLNIINLTNPSLGWYAEYNWGNPKFNRSIVFSEATYNTETETIFLSTILEDVESLSPQLYLNYTFLNASSPAILLSELDTSPPWILSDIVLNREEFPQLFRTSSYTTNEPLWFSWKYLHAVDFLAQTIISSSIKANLKQRSYPPINRNSTYLLSQVPDSYSGIQVVLFDHLSQKITVVTEPHPGDTSYLLHQDTMSDSWIIHNGIIIDIGQSTQFFIPNPTNFASAPWAVLVTLDHSFDLIPVMGRVLNSSSYFLRNSDELGNKVVVPWIQQPPSERKYAFSSTNPMGSLIHWNFPNFPNFQQFYDVFSFNIPIQRNLPIKFGILYSSVFTPLIVMIIIFLVYLPRSDETFLSIYHSCIFSKSKSPHSISGSPDSLVPDTSSIVVFWGSNHWSDTLAIITPPILTCLQLISFMFDHRIPWSTFVQFGSNFSYLVAQVPYNSSAVETSANTSVILETILLSFLVAMSLLIFLFLPRLFRGTGTLTGNGNGNGNGNGTIREHEQSGFFTSPSPPRSPPRSRSPEPTVLGKKPSRMDIFTFRVYSFVLILTFFLDYPIHLFVSLLSTLQNSLKKSRSTSSYKSISSLETPQMPLNINLRAFTPVPRILLLVTSSLFLPLINATTSYAVCSLLVVINDGNMFAAAVNAHDANQTETTLCFSKDKRVGETFSSTFLFVFTVMSVILRTFTPLVNQLKTSFCYLPSFWVTQLVFHWLFILISRIFFFDHLMLKSVALLWASLGIAYLTFKSKPTSFMSINGFILLTHSIVAWVSICSLIAQVADDPFNPISGIFLLVGIFLLIFLYIWWYFLEQKLWNATQLSRGFDISSFNNETNHIFNSGVRITLLKQPFRVRRKDPKEVNVSTPLLISPRHALSYGTFS